MWVWKVGKLIGLQSELTIWTFISLPLFLCIALQACSIPDPGFCLAVEANSRKVKSWAPFWRCQLLAQPPLLILLWILSDQQSQLVLLCKPFGLAVDCSTQLLIAALHTCFMDLAVCAFLFLV